MRDLSDKLEDLPETIVEHTPTVEEQARKPVWKLRIENSESREKYPNDCTLTHMQSNIGELTPISIETNIESSSTSEVAEIPSDISAVLSIVEAKNNEELNKLKEKISNLTKENETLTMQLKKYIGAIQMLNRDDETRQMSVEDLDFDSDSKTLDYKHEAKIFETKLVQVCLCN